MPFDPTQVTTLIRGRGPRRPIKVQQLTQHEAKQEALRLSNAGLVGADSKIRVLIDVMSSTGIVPQQYLQDFLPMQERSLRRYREKTILQRVPIPPSLVPCLPTRTYFLYALGMVGLELATLIHGRTPSGYIESEHDTISHDVLCNVVYHALYHGVRVLDYAAVLYNRYEATIHDYKGKALLEPDAMVVLKHATHPRQVYLIEYHHEDFGRRAESKVLKYERVLREYPELWQSKWQTSVPPTVLVVWTHKAVGAGYRKYFDERRRAVLPLRARWLGKPLQAFTQKQTVLVWEDLGAAQPKARLIPPV